MPSERSFSVMNLIHSKLRNSLTPERVHKLQYVYINQRTFRKMAVQTFSDEDLLELEDNWLEENHTELDARSGEQEDMGDIAWIDEVIEVDDTD